MLNDEQYKRDHADNTFDELAAGYKTPVERSLEERTSDAEGVPSPSGNTGDEAEQEDASPVATGD